MAIDFNGLVNAVVTDPAIFGKAIVYTPKGGAPFSLNVVFDEAWATVSFSAVRRGLAAEVSTTKPCFGCRASDFPTEVEPKQYDTCVIDGEDFSVSDAQPDGVSGWFLVTLN